MRARYRKNNPGVETRVRSRAERTRWMVDLFREGKHPSKLLTAKAVSFHGLRTLLPEATLTPVGPHRTHLLNRS